MPPSGDDATTRVLHADHDHNSGIVRGFLCVSCNLGLGCFRDSPDLMREGAQYIEMYMKDKGSYKETRVSKGNENG